MIIIMNNKTIKTTPKAKKRKDAEHYVDNKEFLKHLKVFVGRVNEAKQKNEPRPQVPDFLGECILAIANKLSNRPNFINYPFKDEMISDGIENCLMYIGNFNPEKSNNPFAYFTQIIYFAFIRRIQKEKKHLYTKYRMIEETLMHDIPEDDHLRISRYGSEYSDGKMHEFLKDFDDAKAKKTKKRINPGTTSKARKKKSSSKNLEDVWKKMGPMPDSGASI